MTNKTIVNLVDRAIDNGTTKVKLSRNQYKTFVRIVFEKVYNDENPNEFVIYRGAMVGMWREDDKSKLAILFICALSANLCAIAGLPYAVIFLTSVMLAVGGLE